MISLRMTAITAGLALAFAVPAMPAAAAPPCTAGVAAGACAGPRLAQNDASKEERKREKAQRKHERRAKKAEKAQRKEMRGASPRPAPRGPVTAGAAAAAAAAGAGAAYAAPLVIDRLRPDADIVLGDVLGLSRMSRIADPVSFGLPVLTDGSAYYVVGNHLVRAVEEPILLEEIRVLDPKVDCPPGLAKKEPACIPPGQVDKVMRTPWDDGRAYVRITDPAAHGLAAPDGDWDYYTVEGVIVRVDRDSHRILSLVGMAEPADAAVLPAPATPAVSAPAVPATPIPPVASPAVTPAPASPVVVTPATEPAPAAPTPVTSSPAPVVVVPAAPGN